ncbi:MAG: glycosyltransferase [Saprospiraceae bacterium]|nr:glycosyltransferase [Saprospiraceae bacterium]
MPKRILIVNNGLAGGGIERASVSLANCFNSKGYLVSVLALYKSEKFFKLDDGIKFIEPDFSRRSINKYLYLFKLIRFIRHSVKQLNPDTILSFGEWTNPFVILAITGTGYPIFVSDRMSPIAMLPFVSEYMRKKLYKRATGIIAQSKFAKSILEKKTNSKNIKVINNPVNAIEKIECPQLNRIVTVGRLEKVKGHEYLIKAFAKIEDQDWELSIVGDGSERPYLENLTKVLNIDNKVIFHGHLRDFRKQLSEAKIFVLPSLSEGFPNALIEAMSLPLPCISTDFLFGQNEIVEDGINGLLVPPADVEALTNTLNNLILDQDLRKKLSKNALHVREDLAFEKIADQYLNFIFEHKR